MNLLPKIKLEVVVKDEALQEVLDIIVKEARTEEVGGGKIFVYHVENAIRIRTGELGEKAI